MPVRKKITTNTLKEKPTRVPVKPPKGAGKIDKLPKAGAVKQAPQEPPKAEKKSAAKTEKKKSSETKKASQKSHSRTTVTPQRSVPKGEKQHKTATAGKVRKSTLKTEKKTIAKKDAGLAKTTKGAAKLNAEEPAAVKLLKQLRETLDSRKAEDIVILDLREVSGYLDYFLLATALSPLHVKNLANETADLMRSAGYRPLNNISAEIESGWQILDYGEIVVHLFTAEKRAFYDLEKLWEKAGRVP